MLQIVLYPQCVFFKLIINSYFNLVMIIKYSQNNAVVQIMCKGTCFRNAGFSIQWPRNITVLCICCVSLIKIFAFHSKLKTVWYKFLSYTHILWPKDYWKVFKSPHLVTLHRNCLKYKIKISDLTWTWKTGQNPFSHLLILRPPKVLRERLISSLYAFGDFFVFFLLNTAEITTLARLS